MVSFTTNRDRLVTPQDSSMCCLSPQTRERIIHYLRTKHHRRARNLRKKRDPELMALALRYEQ